MPAGDLNDGSRFGLPPIGFTNASLSTEGSDTQRRAFPGLATKSSVFAWQDAPPALVSTGPLTALNDTVNLRNNTATGGVSVDVPTWAAGCVVIVSFSISAISSSTYVRFTTLAAVSSSSPIVMRCKLTSTVQSETRQVIIPFYDEPTFTQQIDTDGLGTGVVTVRLEGFIRNV